MNPTLGNAPQHKGYVKLTPLGKTVRNYFLIGTGVAVIASGFYCAKDKSPSIQPSAVPAPAPLPGQQASLPTVNERTTADTSIGKISDVGIGIWSFDASKNLWTPCASCRITANQELTIKGYAVEMGGGQPSYSASSFNMFQTPITLNPGESTMLAMKGPTIDVDYNQTSGYHVPVDEERSATITILYKTPGSKNLSEAIFILESPVFNHNPAAMRDYALQLEPRAVLEKPNLIASVTGVDVAKIESAHKLILEDPNMLTIIGALQTAIEEGDRTEQGNLKRAAGRRITYLENYAKYGPPDRLAYAPFYEEPVMTPGLYVVQGERLVDSSLFKLEGSVHLYKLGKTQNWEQARQMKVRLKYLGSSPMAVDEIITNGARTNLAGSIFSLADTSLVLEPGKTYELTLNLQKVQKTYGNEEAFEVDIKGYRAGVQVSVPLVLVLVDGVNVHGSGRMPGFTLD